MKNISISIIIAFIGLVFSCKTLELEYSKPTINDISAIIIDSYDAEGYIRDYIKLHNKSTTVGIDFTLYVHEFDSGNWVEFCIGHLKGKDDTDTIKSKLSGKLNNYRYFAIKSLGLKCYAYEIYKDNRDFHINIVENNSNSEIVTVFRGSNKSLLIEKRISNNIKRLELEERNDLQTPQNIVYAFEYIVTIEQAYKLSKLWVVDTFNSAKDVITFDDIELAILAGRFNFKSFLGGIYWCNFKIDLNKNILTFNGFSVDGKDMMEGGVKRIHNDLDKIAEGYGEAINP
jgi:hypothetical protein